MVTTPINPQGSSPLLQEMPAIDGKEHPVSNRLTSPMEADQSEIHVRHGWAPGFSDTGTSLTGAFHPTSQYVSECCISYSVKDAFKD